MKLVIKLILSCSMIYISLGCESAGKKTAFGAAAGAAGGAAIGAIIGHQTGNRKKGALIGAAIGGTAGALYGRKLDKQAKELEAANIAEVKRTEQGIVTKLKGDILFPSGLASLKPAAKSRIGKMGDILKKYPENKILIIGHTDSTGKATTNQRISKQRADAVKVLLIGRGVPAGRITTMGMGESQPVSTNKTKRGRATNRRVEMQITMEEQG